MPSPPELGRLIRPYQPSDEPEVLALINDDRLIGQPSCSWNMLEAARAGWSPFDAERWSHLARIDTAVAVDPDGVVLGVVSTTLRRSDGTGQLLWLHGAEDPAVIQLLVDAAVSHLADRPISAFRLLTPLALGQSGLPAEHRQVTNSILRKTAFTPTSTATYAHQHLSSPPSPRRQQTLQTSTPTYTTHRIQSADAHLTVTLSQDGRAWISQPTPPTHPQTPTLMKSALTYLTTQSAHQAATTIPPTLQALYQDLGFNQVDDLFTYHRPNPIAGASWLAVTS